MKIINQIYNPFGLLLLIFLLLMGINAQAQAQNSTASGIVLDDLQTPLVGVNIVLADNPSVGTTTDVDGKFELKCPANSTLEFSYIGFNTVLHKAATGMNIVLIENAVMLQEAVVVGVGYGTMRKSDLTGAIASIGKDDLKKGIVTSAEQMLQGKISGLAVVQSTGDPSAGSTLRLRGGTSLSAGNSPLVVIDGIPGVDINTVQPSEIVSVDVLKDASSAAIYGSRGANGVIIITTNRSTSGKPSSSIQYNGYFAVGKIAKHMDLLSANQWRHYVRENNLKDATDYGANTNWQKEIERTAFTHSHNIAANSISENSGYSASITYLNSEGVIKRNKMNRLSASVSGHQYGLNKRLKLDVGLTGSVDQWNPIDNRIFERVANLNPTVPVRYENGDFFQLDGTLTENPVEILTNRLNDDSRNRLLGYGKIELDIIDGLKSSSIGSYEYNSYKRRYYLPSYAYMDGISEQGRGERGLSEYRTMQLETFFTYDKTFQEIHKLNLMAGYSYRVNVYEGFGASRRGFDTDEFGYDNLGAGNDYRQGDVYSYKGEEKLASFFGRINYNLMSKYMITTTLRRDGSSKFGANHKWGMFPSVSVAWRMSEENFMQGTKTWLDDLKVRFGFGVTGNQDGIGAYKSLALLGPSNTSIYYDSATGTWKNAYIPIQNTNPGLKWESTQQYNVGFDFLLLNRITGSIELYHKKTKDLLWEYEVPQPPNLVNRTLANVGNLTNNGVELTLGSNILKIGDFSWDANVTVSYNKQKMNSLSNDQYTQSDKGIQAGSLHNVRGFSGIYTQYIREGYPVGAFFGPKAIGVTADGKYIFETDDEGEVLNDQYLGSAQPKVNLGLNMSFSYKEFDLNVSGYGMFGQKVLNATTMSMYDASRLPAQNVPDKFLSSGIWDKATYSDYWVEDGSFFRLQSMTLGYTLPFDLKKAGFNKIRFYGTVENLFTITKYTGIDPEVSIELLADPNDLSKVGAPGVDVYNTYPRPRTFSLGLNLSF